MAARRTARPNARRLPARTRRAPQTSVDARRAFDAQQFLTSAGISRQRIDYPARTVIYSQGDAADTVFYILDGGVSLSVVSSGGKEAIVAMLGAAEFFGEGSLAGQTQRMSTATTFNASSVIAIETQQMQRVLHEQHALSDLFIAHVLARNITVEADLVDHLFNASEKRLARTLVTLSRFGRQDRDQRVLPRISQTVLAEMVGTTRSRVNVFMNKFRRLGFVDYGRELRINTALLTLALRD